MTADIHDVAVGALGHLHVEGQVLGHATGVFGLKRRDLPFMLGDAALQTVGFGFQKCRRFLRFFVPDLRVLLKESGQQLIGDPLGRGRALVVETHGEGHGAHHLAGGDVGHLGVGEFRRNELEVDALAHALDHHRHWLFAALLPIEIELGDDVDQVLHGRHLLLDLLDPLVGENGRRGVEDLPRDFRLLDLDKGRGPVDRGKQIGDQRHQNENGGGGDEEHPLPALEHRSEVVQVEFIHVSGSDAYAFECPSVQVDGVEVIRDIDEEGMGVRVVVIRPRNRAVAIGWR